MQDRLKKKVIADLARIDSMRERIALNAELLEALNRQYGLKRRLNVKRGSKYTAYPQPEKPKV
jgi:hypothetical protein